MKVPSASWANNDDCGFFPCTAPYNVFVDFQDTAFSGSYFPGSAPNFQAIPDTPETSEFIQDCEYVQKWKGYFCKNDYLGQLLFESLDADTMDRTISPIYITNSDTGFNNTLNSMMDHVWDGFYTGQLRLSRFPSLITTDQNYTVTTTGTQPGSMRYTLDAAKGGMVISVPYFNAGSYAIEIDGTKVEPTEWDEELGAQSNLTGNAGCGENRYLAVVNILEFYLTPGCIVVVKP